MKLEAEGCLQHFLQHHTVYKSSSAILWRQDTGEWHILQRDGFPSSCFSHGGRFFFATLLYDRASVDLGVCFPETCSAEDILWRAFPLLYQQFFHMEQIRQFGVQLRKHHHITWGLVLQKVQSLARASWSWRIGLCVLAAAWVLLVRSLSLAVRDPAPAATGEARARAPGGRGLLQLCVVLGLAAGEVMLHTRWQKYEWHREHSWLFSAGQATGRLSWLALSGLQLFGAAAAAAGSPPPLRALGTRALRLLLLLLLWAQLCSFLDSDSFLGESSSFPLSASASASLQLHSRPNSRSTKSIDAESASAGAGVDHWLDWLKSSACLEGAQAMTPLALVTKVWAPTCQGLQSLQSPHLLSILEELRYVALAVPGLLLARTAAAAAMGPRLATLLALAVCAALASASSAGGLDSWRALEPQVRAALQDSLALAALASARAARAKGCGMRLLLPAALAALIHSTTTTTWPFETPLAVAALLLLLADTCPLVHSVVEHPAESLSAVTPAIPLCVSVLEGRIEPHSKVLTVYDFTSRVLGVAGVSLLAGAAASGLGRFLATVFESVDVAWRLSAAWSVRLTLEREHEHIGAGIEPLRKAASACSCRVSAPLALLLFSLFLLLLWATLLQLSLLQLQLH